MADSEKIREGVDKLSPNLREILELTCQGESAAAIAEKLSMGESTVRRDRSIIRQFCEVKTNQEICDELARQAGEPVIDIPDDDETDEEIETETQPDQSTSSSPSQPESTPDFQSTSTAKVAIPDSEIRHRPKHQRRSNKITALSWVGIAAVLLLLVILSTQLPRFLGGSADTDADDINQTEETPAVFSEDIVWENGGTSLEIEDVRYNTRFKIGAGGAVLAFSVRFLYRNESTRDILVHFDKSNFDLVDNDGRSYQCYTDSTIGGSWDWLAGDQVFNLTVADRGTLPFWVACGQNMRLSESVRELTLSVEDFTDDLDSASWLFVIPR